ncbi:MAG: DUF2263 domain-containing protein [Tatlockia sp.]|nr:DUF2263 domain-containing protein [Tatlockia sp.]
MKSKKELTLNLVIADYLPLIQSKATPIQISDFFANSKPMVKLKDLNPHHSPITEDAGVPNEITDSLFTTGQYFAESTVVDNCWKSKDQVNLFYHNLLSCFVYIYLDPLPSPIEQIQIMKTQLESNQNDLVNLLISRYLNTLNAINSNNQSKAKEPVVVTNAANGKFLGGVSSYGKGSAEEALCRQSDLFLRMLLENATGAYQKNILMSILTIFENILSSKSLPISGPDSSKELALHMLKTITKSGFEGYCLYYQAKELSNRTHLNQNIIFTDNKNLPSIAQLQNPNSEEKQAFLNNCSSNIYVISVASKDNRLIGSNPSDFFFGSDANFRQLSEDILSLTQSISREQNSSVKLIVLPIGCGAFGNKPTDFGKNFKFALRDLARRDEISEITLATFDDNYLELVDTFEEMQGYNFLNYENKGKSCLCSVVNLFSKVQDIGHYSRSKQGLNAKNKALVVSVSANRKELPSGLSLYSKSALTSLCNEVNSRNGNVEAFAREFKKGMTENAIFNSPAASACFNRYIYFQSIQNKKNEISSDCTLLVNEYKTTLLQLDNDGFKSVELTLFGTGAGGYSLEESCNAFLQACLTIQLSNLQEISIITTDLELMNKIAKQLSESNNPKQPGMQNQGMNI